MSIEQALSKAGIELPTPIAPAANYVSYVVQGGIVMVSGQLPMEKGVLKYTGKVTGDEGIAEAQEAARLCGVNLLAQLRQACGGDWTRFERAVKLTVFVNAPSGFTKAHLVANGVSDFLVQILGENGRHARSAMAVAELPLGALVEVEAIFALKV